MITHEHITSLLDTYKPFDEREAQFKRDLEAFVAANDDITTRDNILGHITASAFVYAPQKDALLLVHHKKSGKWIQPGGHIESNDTTLQEAARREVLEETGLTVSLESDAIFDIDIHAITAHKDVPAHTHLDVCFLCSTDLDTLTVSDESHDVQWVPLDTIAEYNSEMRLQRVISKLKQR